LFRTANPWLDFLSPTVAHSLAKELNDDLEEYCATSPELEGGGEPSIRRLYGFGLLPLVPNIAIGALLQVIKQVASLPHLKGIIMGTKAIGKGLDDPEMEPVWQALAETRLVVFLHPHYGLGVGAQEAWGDQDYGHVLPLALGFPVETAIVCSFLPKYSGNSLLNPFH
jgi:aminocarboxymuconate-semialdehyde decarboxylase